MYNKNMDRQFVCGVRVAKRNSNEGTLRLVYLDSAYRLRWDEHVCYRLFRNFTKWTIGYRTSWFREISNRWKMKSASFLQLRATRFEHSHIARYNAADMTTIWSWRSPNMLQTSCFFCLLDSVHSQPDLIRPRMNDKLLHRELHPIRSVDHPW